MKKLWIILTLGLSCLSLIVIGGCDKKGGKEVITFNNMTEPGSIDPQLCTDTVGSNILRSTMEGLVQIGDKGVVLPGVASSWETSKDGLTWTFHLRDNAKWSNGTPVTANDFFFAWKRALSPVTASNYAYNLYYIKNAQAYNTGKITDFSQVGVKVINATTLEVLLAEPTPYFIQLLAFATYMPLNESFYQSVGKNYALSAKDMIYNGPFMITSWTHGGSMTLEKNPNYWDEKSIKLKKINVVMVTNYATASNMYKSNQIDVTKLSADQIEQYKGNSALKQAPDGSVWYLQFNTKTKILSNEKIRQAITYAIDRKTLTQVIQKGVTTPATAFVPFGITDGSGEFRKDFKESYFVDNDVSLAQKLFEQGKKELGITGSVTIKLLIDNSDAANRNGQFLQQQLFKTLGINVVLEPNPFQIRVQKMNSGNYEMVFAGWSPDYNDPMTFLDMWVTNGGNNNTGWSNATYDQLIATAKGSANQNIRMKLMSQAENILMQQLPIAPLYYGSQIYLVRPTVKDVIFNFGNPIFDNTFVK